jgi:uncharacterized membrane protein YidH (DUF202 family)
MDNVVSTRIGDLAKGLLDTGAESDAERSGTDKVEHGAEAVRHNPFFRAFAGVGLLARAVVYLVVGGLVLDIAASGRGPAQADSQGAFAEIRRQPAGAEILALLAAGLAAYAVWRFVEACSRRPRGQQISRWTRGGWFAISALYVGLCVSVVQLMAGSSANEGPAQHPSSFASSVLHLFLGPLLLGLIAATLAISGIALVIWGIRHDYSKSLQTEKMSKLTSHLAGWSGIIGNASRGVAVTLVAWSFFGSAVSDDPDRAKSLDASLHMLAGSLPGAVLLVAIGAGFLSFGLHSIIEARFGRV